ncbi:Dihydroneopterin aldolase-domain-containing protein [Panaeolus papilionaceus]|nr:Dihydroneopterin aldolase-domain-containing protein [Panaeolus papilionaceus]
MSSSRSTNNSSYDTILISSLTLPAFSYTPLPSSDSSSLDASKPTHPPSTLDHWSKPRPHPTSLSVYLHLTPGFLDACAEHDDVTLSVHYGLLTKRIAGMVGVAASTGSASSKDGEGEGFHNPDHLITRVAAHAFEMGGAAALGVRVVLDMPKFILLANGFEIDAVVSPSSASVSSTSTLASISASTSAPASTPITPEITQKRVHVKDLIIPVIIGVNPPERLSKQRVIVNITFSEGVDGTEGTREGEEVDYQAIVKDIYDTLSSTTYLTLEKFALHIANIGLVANERIESVQVRAQKPSALSFAGSSGVEVRRARGSV